MGKEISRQALYELVWSKPWTSLAKELGISDVAIRKHCIKVDVPVPPAGYWARLQHGKSVFRPPLPLRMPGHPDAIEIGGRDDLWYRPRTEDLNTVPEAPLFLEDIDMQVAAAVKRIGIVAACRDLSSPHQAIRRLLSVEEERREKYEKNRHLSFHKPRFDAPQHLRQLRIFNSLALALGRVFPSIDVHAKEDWVQGYGVQYYLNMRFGVGSVFMTLEFLEPDDVRLKKKNSVISTTLRTGGESLELDLLSWSDEKGKKIERQLGEIVSALVYRAEKIIRGHAEWVYQRRLELRKEILAEQEEKRREDERKRLEAIAARQRKVRQEIVKLADDRRAAREIREMVNDLESHPDLRDGADHRFAKWKSEALIVADGLDPMNRSMEDLLANFAELPKE